jgi:hypothetical protein
VQMIRAPWPAVHFKFAGRHSGWHDSRGRGTGIRIALSRSWCKFKLMLQSCQ